MVREIFNKINWKAVFAGSVIFMFGGVFIWLVILVGGVYLVEKFYNINTVGYSVTKGVISYLFYFVFMMGCGYYSGRANRSAPVLNGLLVGIVTFFFFVVISPFGATPKCPSPLWEGYVFAVSLIPSALLGGYIAFKSAK